MLVVPWAPLPRVHSIMCVCVCVYACGGGYVHMDTGTCKSQKRGSGAGVTGRHESPKVGAGTQLRSSRTGSAFNH